MLKGLHPEVTFIPSADNFVTKVSRVDEDRGNAIGIFCPKRGALEMLVNSATEKPRGFLKNKPQKVSTTQQVQEIQGQRN